MDRRIPVRGIIFARFCLCASSPSLFCQLSDPSTIRSLCPLHDTACQGTHLYAPCSALGCRLICVVEQLHDRTIQELALRLGGSKAALLNASLVRFPLLSMTFIGSYPLPGKYVSHSTYPYNPSRFIQESVELVIAVCNNTIYRPLMTDSTPGYGSSQVRA